MGIQSLIGPRAIAAFGNSDGDLQMLEWTTAGAGARFALFVHHERGARVRLRSTGQTAAVQQGLGRGDG